MKNENNFELSNIELTESEQLVEIKDDELKQVTGGSHTDQTAGGSGSGRWNSACMHKH